MAKKAEKKEETWLDTVKTLGWAIGIALVVRTFLFEPFNIPSGSMIPTLLKGDYMFVNKMSYGYSKYSFPFGIVPMEGRVFASEPERGDVAVFRQPKQPDIDYVKRIIGLPGDRIQMIAGVLHINGEAVKRRSVPLDDLDMDQRYDLQMSPRGAGVLRYFDGSVGKSHQLYIETLPNGREHYIFEVNGDHPPLEEINLRVDADNTNVYTVPEGHYFAMGDNRDRSQDSRFLGDVGFVPFENLVGEASFFFFSVDDSATLWKPWTWFGGIRYSRLFNGID